ncbi:hypothetical protein SPD48_16180 [Pseudogracilibacillus sp. SE30717A]|uniref:hypothetical protein n=1 Tax=Pseudogracilibacillus sp. SE30717A TaxID=3098293 RepID=UPI00300E0796
MKKFIGISMLMVLLFLSGCGTILDVIGGREGMIFGTGTFEDGIQDKKSTFRSNEDFLLEAYSKKAFGTSEIKITTLKNDNNKEEIYEEWYDKVDPTWNEMLYEFHVVDYDGEYEPGDYIVRIFKDETNLLVEGTFSIEE